jgi:hypothetical protein
MPSVSCAAALNLLSKSSWSGTIFCDITILHAHNDLPRHLAYHNLNSQHIFPQIPVNTQDNMLGISQSP